MKKRIFAFDMGKASIGYCVREDNEIKTANSIIINKDHGEITTKRDRRRAKRILDAHKARENFLNELWQKSGLEVLSKGSPLFAKEFPSKNENIIYNSTLLRIALLQNKPLKDWQIYKALHSAIQRRGYDPDIAWASNQSQDDKENLELIKKYTQEDDKELITQEEYKYPCYYDAKRLGLWNEENPAELNKSIPLNNFNKVRSTKYAAPRILVIKELTQLWLNTQKQLPQLEKISVEEFLYGNYRKAYGSYNNPDLRKFMGKKEDWTGVLGQKIPRFDNRIISKCRLLPKRNVCKANTLENVTFVLLMKLKNLRLTESISGNKISLNSEQISIIYQNWHAKMQSKNKLDTTITKDEIQKAIGKKFDDKFDPLKANISGRSSFCRRACNILNKIILEGIEPLKLDIGEFCDKENTKDGIFENEIKQMLKSIGNWDNLYISDNRDSEARFADLRQETDKIIGSITNSIVKNRLQIFRDLLLTLIEKHGIATDVIFEFPREDSLYGDKRTKEWESRIKEGKKKNEEIKKELEDIEGLNGENFLKLKLLKMQQSKCIYSGKTIGISNFSECEIDHIFPRSKGGNDALYNKVLCYRIYNQEKGSKTPYEWLKNTEKWGEYLNRINGLKESLNNNLKDSTKNIKYQLLTSSPEDCLKLIDSYNGLAETGYIARIAQKITACIFNWKIGAKDEKRHIFINNGAETSRIRKQYHLNSLLGNDIEKNRDNDKHHALDAICISFSQDYKNNRGHLEAFTKELVEKALNKITPIPYTHKKPFKGDTVPDDTIYGKRKYDNKTYIANRIDITSFEQNSKKIKTIVDVSIKEDLLNKLEENLDKKSWANMLSDYIHPKKKTKVKKVTVIVSEGQLEKDNNGIERINEFADFGNKGTKGQFKHSKRHKGQILYYNEKGAIKVMPIYANQKTIDVKNKLSNLNCKLYSKGQIFYSGMLVEIPNDFKGGKNIYSGGIYKLKSIWSDGPIVIENSNGIKILTSAKYLTEAGFKKAKIKY